MAAPSAQSQIDLHGSTEEWTAVSQTKVPHRQGCLYEEWARHGGEQLKEMNESG